MATGVDWRAILGGLTILVAAGVLFALAPTFIRWQLLAAGIFVGTFALLVLGPGSARGLHTLLVNPPFRTIHGIIQDLHLKGRPIYVPARFQAQLSHDLVYIPKNDDSAEAMPQFEGKTYVYGGTHGGIVLDPPGVTILDEHERVLDQRIADTSLAQLSLIMDSVLPGDRLARAVRYTVAGERVQIRYQPTPQSSICAHMRQASPEIHAVLGCHVCSALFLALTRSLGAPIRWLEARESGVEVVIEGEILG